MGRGRAPGKVILVGCAQMFRKNFVTNAGNLDLFLNCVDGVTLGDDLINVRGRKPIDRAIDMPTKGQRTFWKAVNYAAMSAFIALLGIVVAVVRKRAREAYAASYERSQNA